MREVLCRPFLIFWRFWTLDVSQQVEFKNKNTTKNLKKKSMSMSKIFCKKTGGGRKKLLERGVVLGVIFVK
jgi:hypothetical protein